MLRDLFRQCPDEEEAVKDAIRRYEEDLRGRFGPILVDQVEDIAESLRDVDARERLGVFGEKMERSRRDGGVRSVEIHVGPSRRRGARPRPRWRAADAARVATGRF